jgi:hypothetical protein
LVLNFAVKPRSRVPGIGDVGTAHGAIGFLLDGLFEASGAKQVATSGGGGRNTQDILTHRANEFRN